MPASFEFRLLLEVVVVLVVLTWGSRSVARYGQRSATMKGADAYLFLQSRGLAPKWRVAKMRG